MTTEVVHFPAGVYPSVQRLVPDAGPGQTVSESPFIGAQTVNTFRGAERWRLEMQFEDVTGDDRAELSAFFVRLRVSHNVFLIVNHTANNRGVLSGGSPRVNSINAAGNVVVGNLPGSVSSWARLGDFIGVNSQLKMVLQDAGSDAGGFALLSVWPPFYDVPSSGVVVVVSSACGAFRAVSAIQMTTDPPGYRSSFSVAAIERINSSHVSDFL